MKGGARGSLSQSFRLRARFQVWRGLGARVSGVGGVERVSEPEFQPVRIHSVEVVLVQVLVSDKAKIFIQA